MNRKYEYGKCIHKSTSCKLAPAKGLMKLAKKLGATEVIGPGSKNHAGHIHIAMPRKK